MYIEKKNRDKQYEYIVASLKRGIETAVKCRDKSHITYVLLRASLLAWVELGGGYNNGSDIKAILADVHDEFTVRMAHSLKGKREKNGDLLDSITIEDKETK